MTRCLENIRDPHLTEASSHRSNEPGPRDGLVSRGRASRPTSTRGRRAPLQPHIGPDYGISVADKTCTMVNMSTKVMLNAMTSARRFARSGVDLIWTGFQDSETIYRIRKDTSMNPKRFSLVFLTLLLCVSAVCAQQKKVVQPVKEYTIEQFMNTVRIGGSSFSSDDKSILFHNNKTGIFNVYSVPVTGGAATQLTSSTKESTYAVSYFPNDARFIYTYDRGGNENNHLYVRELDGTERDITPGEKVKANFLGWSHDRKSFFFSTNERDPRFFDIYEMPIDSLKPSLIYKDETGFDFGDISNDKKYIALEKSGGSPADSDVYLYNTATKELKNITAHSGDVANSAQTFDVQSKYLYYLSDAGSEFRYVARYDLATGKSRSRRKSTMGRFLYVLLLQRKISSDCGQRRCAHED